MLLAHLQHHLFPRRVLGGPDILCRQFQYRAQLPFGKSGTQDHLREKFQRLLEVFRQAASRKAEVENTSRGGEIHPQAIHGRVERAVVQLSRTAGHQVRKDTCNPPLPGRVGHRTGRNEELKGSGVDVIQSLGNKPQTIAQDRLVYFFVSPF